MVTAVAAGSWVACRRAVPTTTNKCVRCNVLLVTIDTLRSDRIEGFGGSSLVAPNVSRLGREGLRLTRAYAAAPLTLPSHASILTATEPPVHGIRTNGLYRLGEAQPTLATALKAAGYRTAAFVGAFVLDARFGLSRGFDVYDDRYGEASSAATTDGAERRAEDVIKPALAWITSAPSTRWFAWVHLYDPHEPYRAPEPWASRFPPYDAEVAYADDQLGNLLTSLERAGALADTLVVVAADHGESLGEHGERTHGVFVYDVTMRVPWILWARDRLHGSSDALVRLIDLAPTILDVVGIAAPGAFHGGSVVPRVTGAAESSPAYVEAMDANVTRNWAPLTGLVSGAYKVIDLPIPELYDLSKDPGETTNLYAREPERARTLDALKRDAVTRLSAQTSPASTATLSAEARQRLQALGYVASSAGPATRAFTDRDDPKNLIQPANDLNDALAAFRRGERQGAVAAVRRMVEEYPDFTTAQGVLASMLRESGDLRGAIDTLDRLARRGIADQSVLVVLAGYLREAGEVDRAQAVLEAVVAAHPDYAEAHNSLGVVYSAAGDHARAQAAFRKVIELDPTAATAYENIAIDEMGSGKTDAAVADLNRALELDARLAGAHNALAAILARQGDMSGAIQHWQRAVAENPRLFDALYNLGTALAAQGRADEAKPYLERFANVAPPGRYAADIASVRRALGRRP